MEQVSYDARKCVHCQRCITACEKNALEYMNHQIVFDHSKCDHCLQCAEVCSGGALQKEGYKMGVDDIFAEIIKDQDFYEESNGGVTFSGGEVLNQMKAAKCLAEKCRENHIHVAIETTGYAASEVFQEMIEFVDLILFDFKHADSKLHKEGTGVGNEVILNNLKIAKEMNKDIIIRMPIIPGYNDSMENARKTAGILKELKILNLDLLPFHQLGENKYQLLQKEYQYKDKAQLNKDSISYLKEYYQKEGFHVM